MPSTVSVFSLSANTWPFHIAFAIAFKPTICWNKLRHAFWAVGLWSPLRISNPFVTENTLKREAEGVVAEYRRLSTDSRSGKEEILNGGQGIDHGNPGGGSKNKVGGLRGHIFNAIGKVKLCRRAVLLYDLHLCDAAFGRYQQA